MRTLTVRVTNAQNFLHDILLPTINVLGLVRHLFSGGMAASKEVKTVITKESYLNVGQFKIPPHKDTKCPTIDYLDLELAPRGNYQTEAAFPTRVISGHTIPTGSALASGRLRSGAMGAVAPFATAARPFIATSTAALGHYRNTDDYDNCHGSGEERTSGTSTLDIRMSAPCRPRRTSPRRESISPTR